MRLGLAMALGLVAAACAGEGSSADCADAEQQVALCLDRMCADDDGAFCGCHEAGRHLEAGSFCACADGSVWEQMRESVCEEVPAGPELDCPGLQATVRRFERWENCE